MQEKTPITKTNVEAPPFGRGCVHYRCLAFLTIYDYYLVMINVRIADLKSHLSQYLRNVRRGRTLTVLDRDTPIAKIVPYGENGSLLNVRTPIQGSPKLYKIPLPPPLKLRKDIVNLLLEERQFER